MIGKVMEKYMFESAVNISPVSVKLGLVPSYFE